MDLILKTIAAFCIGLGVMYGIQTFYVRSVMDQIASKSSNPIASLPQMKPAYGNIDASKLTDALKIKPIDTSEGERLGVLSAQRRVDQIVRGAQNAVPVQRSYPGAPRF